MEKKKILVCLSAVCLAAICAFSLFYMKKNKGNLPDISKEPVKIQQNVEEKLTDDSPIVESESIEVNKNNNEVKKISIEKNENIVKNANLYDEGAKSNMPLSVIAVLSDVPQYVRASIEKLSETNNIFMAKKNGDKLIVITDNPSNIRHSVEINEISLVSGHQIKTTLGYNDKMNDSNNDIWEYDKETKLPVRHTKYNQDGDMDFVETWNYDETNQIKYEMKDSEGHTISMRKENLENGTNLRIEHLVYDKKGNTRISVTVTYDGPDVQRFTYYNSEKPSESGSVFGEFSNGLKTKETVYSSDLKVKNYYTTEYKDGNKSNITVWDSQNKEIEKLLPKE